MGNRKDHIVNEMHKQPTLRSSITVNVSKDALQDPSMKRLDKWRSMFHMFNLLTFTVALISLGLSLLTYASATPSPSTVAEYELPMVYYGINGALMTGHTAFGAFACVKAENLKVLKIYTAIGFLLVIEELAIGSWMLATIQNRINAVINKISNLESQHSNHDHDESQKRDTVDQTKRLAKRDDDHTEDHDEDSETSETEDHAEDDSNSVEAHIIYKEINKYYGCCMYAQKWVDDDDLHPEEVYEHCLTNEYLFCGVKFVLFPGTKNLKKTIETSCDCEIKVGEVVTVRILKQTVLLFIALPSQILCLFGVAMFIKFEISFRNNSMVETVSIPNPSTVMNKID
ncbi:uncharacterized protein LOC134817137 isoform X1 [Bolinopsis microptera]|uniref:uncharacterized protein LOC134817137 isoform X1 n=1 Tax=Bolinopsis microptera TaxID=2820187 RepID=UPI00307A46A0